MYSQSDPLLEYKANEALSSTIETILKRLESPAESQYPDAAIFFQPIENKYFDNSESEVVIASFSDRQHFKFTGRKRDFFVEAEEKIAAAEKARVESQIHKQPAASAVPTQKVIVSSQVDRFHKEKPLKSSTLPMLSKPSIKYNMPGSLVAPKKLEKISLEAVSYLSPNSIYHLVLLLVIIVTMTAGENYREEPRTGQSHCRIGEEASICYVRRGYCRKIYDATSHFQY